MELCIIKINTKIDMAILHLYEKYGFDFLKKILEKRATAHAKVIAHLSEEILLNGSADEKIRLYKILKRIHNDIK